MKRRLIIYLIISASTIAVGFFAIHHESLAISKKNFPELSAREIIDKSLASIQTIKTMKYNLQLTERIKGRLIHTESSVKLQRSPRKLYLYLKGPELLWLEGQNNGDALVNPYTFPYINLNLDPMGSLMRKDQHHTIHEMGYDYFANIIRNAIKLSGDKFNSLFINAGTENWNKRPCYKIIVNYPEFSIKQYTVGAGEDMIKIARKLFLSEYMILERNPEKDSYSDISAGEIINVPNVYSKMNILLIDKEFFVPVNSKIYDDQGLFEAYEYHDLEVNPTIQAEEFTKTYSGYHF